MILVWGPFPHAEHSGEGWMRRVAAVDAVLAEHERCYVFPRRLLGWDPQSREDYRPRIERIDERRSLFPIDLGFVGHRQRLLELLDRCDYLYAHTVHSAQHLLPYFATGKIVTDSHGIAPEEAALDGRSQVAQFYEAFEEVALRESAVVVVVTRAMERHYRAKYPGLDTRFLLLPIHNEQPAAASLERPERERPVVVYAGGIQAWQRVDLMMQAVARLRGRYQFRFLTRDLAGMASAAQAAGVREEVCIRYCPPEQLAEEYADADFGFVLRDDSAVNRVACPTKLMEYLAYGVVPVVQLEELGDVRELGARCIRLADFLEGRVPPADALRALRQANRDVFGAVSRLVDEGRRQLASLGRLPARCDLRARRACFLTDLERAQLYPARARCEWVEVRDGREQARKAVVADLAGPDCEVRVPLEGSRPVSLRIYPFEWVNMVTEPAQATVRLVDGTELACDLQGPPRRDDWGNWVFEWPDGFVDLDCSALPLEVQEVRFRLRVLAAGGEVPRSPVVVRAPAPEPPPPEPGIRELSRLLARRVFRKIRLGRT